MPDTIRILSIDGGGISRDHSCDRVLKPCSVNSKHKTSFILSQARRRGVS